MAVTVSLICSLTVTVDDVVRVNPMVSDTVPVRVVVGVRVRGSDTVCVSVPVYCIVGVPLFVFVPPIDTVHVVVLPRVSERFDSVGDPKLTVSVVVRDRDFC